MTTQSAVPTSVDAQQAVTESTARLSIRERAAAVERQYLADPALRYRHCRTGWDLGEEHAAKIASWYALGRDIGPLIVSYRARRAELDTRSGGHGA